MVDCIGCFNRYVFVQTLVFTDNVHVVIVCIYIIIIAYPACVCPVTHHSLHLISSTFSSFFLSFSAMLALIVLQESFLHMLCLTGLLLLLDVPGQLPCLACSYASSQLSVDLVCAALKSCCMTPQHLLKLVVDQTPPYPSLKNRGQHSCSNHTSV